MASLIVLIIIVALGSWIGNLAARNTSAGSIERGVLKLRLGLRYCVFALIILVALGYLLGGK